MRLKDDIRPHNSTLSASSPKELGKERERKSVRERERENVTEKQRNPNGHTNRERARATDTFYDEIRLSNFSFLAMLVLKSYRKLKCAKNRRELPRFCSEKVSVFLL